MGNRMISVDVFRGLTRAAMVIVNSPGDWGYRHLLQPFAPPPIASLGHALANLVVLFALLAWMYRRRWVLRA